MILSLKKKIVSLILFLPLESKTSPSPIFLFPRWDAGHDSILVSISLFFPLWKNLAHLKLTGIVLCAQKSDYLEGTIYFYFSWETAAHLCEAEDAIEHRSSFLTFI